MHKVTPPETEIARVAKRELRKMVLHYSMAGQYSVNILNPHENSTAHYQQAMHHVNEAGLSLECAFVVWLGGQEALNEMRMVLKITRDMIENAKKWSDLLATYSHRKYEPNFINCNQDFMQRNRQLGEEANKHLAKYIDMTDGIIDLDEDYDS